MGAIFFFCLAWGGMGWDVVGWSRGGEEVLGVTWLMREASSRAISPSTTAWRKAAQGAPSGTGRRTVARFPLAVGKIDHRRASNIWVAGRVDGLHGGAFPGLSKLHQLRSKNTVSAPPPLDDCPQRNSVAGSSPGDCAVSRPSWSSNTICRGSWAPRRRLSSAIPAREKQLSFRTLEGDRLAA